MVSAVSSDASWEPAARQAALLARFSPGPPKRGGGMGAARVGGIGGVPPQLPPTPQFMQQQLRQQHTAAGGQAGATARSAVLSGSTMARFTPEAAVSAAAERQAAAAAAAVEAAALLPLIDLSGSAHDGPAAPAGWVAFDDGGAEPTGAPPVAATAAGHLPWLLDPGGIGPLAAALPPPAAIDCGPPCSQQPVLPLIAVPSSRAVGTADDSAADDSAAAWETAGSGPTIVVAQAPRSSPLQKGVPCSAVQHGLHAMDGGGGSGTPRRSSSSVDSSARGAGMGLGVQLPVRQDAFAGALLAAAAVPPPPGPGPLLHQPSDVAPGGTWLPQAAGRSLSWGDWAAAAATER